MTTTITSKQIVELMSLVRDDYVSDDLDRCDNIPRHQDDPDQLISEFKEYLELEYNSDQPLSRETKKNRQLHLLGRLVPYEKVKFIGDLRQYDNSKETSWKPRIKTNICGSITTKENGGPFSIKDILDAAFSLDWGNDDFHTEDFELIEELTTDTKLVIRVIFDTLW